jgi:hypothetical protein
MIEQPDAAGLQDPLGGFSDLPEIQWQFLRPGDRVAVERRGEALSRGIVDEVAYGAAGFWVWLDNGRGRIYLHPGAGSRAWVPERR